jgi:single-stranded DNA-binding protein
MPVVKRKKYKTECYLTMAGHIVKGPSLLYYGGDEAANINPKPMVKFALRYLFRLAGDGIGTWFFHFAAFGKLAEEIAKRYRKGDLIYLRAKPTRARSMSPHGYKEFVLTWIVHEVMKVKDELERVDPQSDPEDVEYREELGRDAPEMEWEAQR